MGTTTISEIVARIKKEQQYQNIFPELIREIHFCLDQELYFAALSLVLMLPDICGKAKYPASNVTSRYIMWYNEYIGQHEKPTSKYDEDMPYLSGEVIYNLRNGFLHAANPTVERTSIKEENNKIDCFELVFGDTLTGDINSVTYTKEWQISHREYILYVKPFCMKMCRVAEQYYAEHKSQFDFFTHKISYTDTY